MAWDPDAPEIVTNGVGWCDQLADKVELDLNFDAVGPTRTAAVDALGDRLRVLDAPEIGPRNISYRRLGVHSQMHEKRGETGYRASEGVGIRLLDVTELEAVLAVLTEGEPESMMGPRWLLQDPSDAYREAQRLAVRDAQKHAEVYADALGGRLGPLRRLSESEGYGHEMAHALSGSAPVVRALSVQPEPVRITARCTTSWTLIT